MEVCEGQQYDIDFETRTDVSIPEYLKMIEYKTAVLVAAAMQMGAIVADASKENQQKCYDFGRNLGIAFQLQDDFLDAFGDSKTFGKQVGGDIIENKKTYLYLKAMALGSEVDKRKLKTLYGKNSVHSDEKIATVLQIFEQTGATEATNQSIQDYTKAAFEVLNSLEIDPIKKEPLRDFGIQLMTRTS